MAGPGPGHVCGGVEKATAGGTLVRAAAVVPISPLQDLHVGKRIEEREWSVATAGESR